MLQSIVPKFLLMKKMKDLLLNFQRGVTQRTQYGNQVKATSAYMSQFQLIALARVHDYLSRPNGSTRS